MSNKTKLKFFQLLIYFILFFNFSLSAQDNLPQFFYIKLDNTYQNWGELNFDKLVKYDSIDANGIPYNLVIYQQIKLISIKFGLISPEPALYRYKLTGYGNSWSKWSSKTEVSYFALPPDKYLFEFQCKTNKNNIIVKQFKFELVKSGNSSFSTIIFTTIVCTLIFSIYYSLKTGALKRNKKLLEKTVQERTAEIVLQKDEISLQKHIVEVKHREISDSINYAKRIQSALLTSQEYWDAISPENFVIWRPKDVVSGDFHWAYQLTIGNKHLMTNQEIAVWCAADCTGHGVPGAFMSMLGMSFLNEIVIENVNLKPADILNKLRRKIISALEHGGTGNIEQKDGMDVALCVWHKNTNMLEYAGANNPVWIMRPVKDTRAHEIIELKANRMPVGYHYDAKDFTEQKFQLKQGDAIYVFTDGFVDQFGGPDGKKYKTKKFKEMLMSIQHLSMKDQALMINKEFNDWRGNNEQIDDLCLVGMKVV
jgi:serine phosphatase RsbU (regulator of sigma subunit)